MREGRELIGGGMAPGAWEAQMMKTSARATLTADGKLEVACATADIGTGTYTILTQIGADSVWAADGGRNREARRFHAARLAGRGWVLDGGLRRLRGADSPASPSGESCSATPRKASGSPLARHEAR